jgi:hypothetical protein
VWPMRRWSRAGEGLIRNRILNLNLEMRKAGQGTHTRRISHQVVESLAQGLDDLIQ